jgi:uncharacterized membrane protein
MKNGIIIGLLLVLVVLILYRRVSCYDNSLIDSAVQMMKEHKTATEILKALEAKGASQKEAFEIANEAEKRL